MFTTCPNCALNLAVSAADLRVGQGYVRCGRCVSVFNALLSLAEDSEIGPMEPRLADSASATQSRPVPGSLRELRQAAGDEAAADPAPARPVAPAGGSSRDAAPEVAAEPEELDSEAALALISTPVPQPVPPEEAQAEHRPEDLPEVLDDTHDVGTGTFETIVLEGEAILQTEEFMDESELDEQIRALAERLDLHEPGDEDAPGEAELSLESAAPRRAPGFLLDGDGTPVAAATAPGVEAAGRAGPETATAHRAAADEAVTDETAAHEAAANPPAATEEAAPDAAPADDWLPASRRGAPARPFVWASIGLAVLLLVQAIHHWRAPLARRVPLLGGLYAAVGAPIPPRWRLQAYDVRQLGAATDPEDSRRIEVRASVRNTAREPQPAPLLRVVLQDRFGNELARRDLAPAQYLRGAPVTMLAADQRVDASLRVEDPDQKAVGFELDACLPTAQGAIRCAAESAPPPP